MHIHWHIPQPSARYVHSCKDKKNLHVLTHNVGDGFTNLRFARLLSQSYQGLAPLDPPPTYDPVPTYPFILEQHGNITIPDYMHFYSLRGPPPYGAPGRRTSVPVTIRLTTAQIDQLHKGVVAQSQDVTQPRISRQDALGAFLAFSTSKADPDATPIQHIISMTMVRPSALCLLYRLT